MTVPQRLSRADVLDAAEQLLTRDGPQGLSVRRIADALGVSRQIVYSRFRGKPDLVRALHAEGFRRLDDRFASAPGPLGSTANVQAMARAYRAAAHASPALYGLMFGRPVMEFEPDDEARALAVASFEPVVAASGAWLAGRGRPATRRAAVDLARTVWAAAHGVVSLELAGLLDRDADVLLARLVAAALGTDSTSSGPGRDPRPGSRQRAGR